MMNKIDLINFFTLHCSDIEGVSEQEVDNFLELYSLNLRSEHRNFLINYGNSKKLISQGFTDCSFKKFKDYYIRHYNNSYENDVIASQEIVPNNTVFFGLGFSDILCIENDSGGIYMIKKLIY